MTYRLSDSNTYLLRFESCGPKHLDGYYYRSHLRNFDPAIPNPTLWDFEAWNYVRTYCHNLADVQFMFWYLCRPPH